MDPIAFLPRGPAPARARAEVAAEPYAATLALALARPGAGDGALRVHWLGQAGFVLGCGAARLVVDPYLSDSLAVKYAGTEFPHQRLFPPPIAPSAIEGATAILCTHRHTDHMDPGTLPALCAGNPGAPVLVPRAEQERARAVGVPEAQLRLVDAGDRLVLGGAQIEALPSAHEALTRDAGGHYHHLGFAIRLGGFTLYHSGDCVPYDGLAERLEALGVDVALLPINGRDAYRLSRGVPGNFALDEAIALCRAARIPVLVGHHFGLFAFNTVDRDRAARALAAQPPGLLGLLPDLDRAWRFKWAAPGDEVGGGGEARTGS